MDQVLAANLTAEEAREVVDRIAQRTEDFVVAVKDDVIRAYQGRAWTALGYASWDTLCEKEWRNRIPRELILDLRQAGLSTRAVAAATGVSPMTVSRSTGVPNVTPEQSRQSGESNDSPKPQETPSSSTEPSATTTTGLDGKKYSSKKRTEEALGFLRDGKENGGTVFEYSDAYGLTHGQASAELSRLSKAGKSMLLQEKRGRGGIYVLPEYVLGRPVKAAKQSKQPEPKPKPQPKQTKPQYAKNPLNGKTSPTRERELKGVKKGEIYFERTRAQRRIAELCTVLEATGIEYFELDDPYEAGILSDILSDLVWLDIWVTRTITGINAHMKEEKLRELIQKLEDPTGRTPEEAVLFKAKATKYRLRLLENKIAAA